MKITKEWLIQHRAYENEGIKFAKEWPEETEVTESSLKKAQEMGINIGWFARALPLTTEAKAEFERVWRVARDAFQISRMVSLSEYNVAHAASRSNANNSYVAAPWAEQRGIFEKAETEHYRCMDVLWAKYESDRLPAIARYNQAVSDALIAAILATIYEGQET